MVDFDSGSLSTIKLSQTLQEGVSNTNPQAKHVNDACKLDFD